MGLGLLDNFLDPEIVAVVIAIVIEDISRAPEMVGLSRRCQEGHLNHRRGAMLGIVPRLRRSRNPDDPRSCTWRRRMMRSGSRFDFEAAAISGLP